MNRHESANIFKTIIFELHTNHLIDNLSVYTIAGINERIIILNLIKEVETIQEPA